MTSSPQVILVTGSMAAGKSTVAQALAERLPRSVHLRGDAFRRMIVNGRAAMTADLSEEALAQLWLRYRLAATSAVLYVQAGFTVVYQDIVIGPLLSEVVALYQGLSLAVVVLCPRPEVLAARDGARAKTGYPDAASVRAFDDALRNDTPRLGYWLDTSDLSVDATVEQVMRHLPQAIIEEPASS